MYKYLQMIYGIKFEDDFSYYIHKRRIDRKIKCSVSEEKINHRLLSIPFDQICEDNIEYKNLIQARILEENIEKTLDARL